MSNNQNARIQSARGGTKLGVKNVVTGAVFDSVTECSKFYGIDVADLSKILNGKKRNYTGHILELIKDGATMEEEIWKTIASIPSYSVSTHGRVMNNGTGKLIRTSYTKQGAAKVGLVDDGYQHTRSIKVLVADAFVPGRNETCNTPIHIDGDQMNNYVFNLAWRPRWFAWKYARQFFDVIPNQEKGPLFEVASGTWYATAIDAALDNGLLVEEVWRSIVMKTEAFPTNQRFELM